MIPDKREGDRFDSESQELQCTGDFETVEEACLFLIHLQAYEEAKKLARDRTVLDVGCNNGYGTMIMSASGAKAFGIDISFTAVQEAINRNLSGTATFVRGDGNMLPFGDEAFDVILAFQVIEHMSNCAHLLNEIRRVLRRGGKALITTPNSLIRLDPGMKPWNRSHVREYSAESMKKLLDGFFEKVDVKGLFAAEPWYSVELNRNKRYLGKARLSRNASRSIPYRIKSVLPATLVETVKRVVRLIKNNMKGNSMLTWSGQEFEERGSEAFFYRHHELSDALDLFAECEKGA